jgi:hypothetical protein
VNKTFQFDCSSGDHVYVERDVIHIPRPVTQRVRQAFDP